MTKHPGRRGLGRPTCPIVGLWRGLSLCPSSGRQTPLRQPHPVSDTHCHQLPQTRRRPHQSLQELLLPSGFSKSPPWVTHAPRNTLGRPGAMNTDGPCASGSSGAPNKILFPPALEAGRPRSRRWQGFLFQALPLGVQTADPPHPLSGAPPRLLPGPLVTRRKPSVLCCVAGVSICVPRSRKSV